jgi:hypothetical protein
MISNYDIEYYNLDEISYSNTSKKIKLLLPVFQRGVVWKKSRRADFINNVKKGDPFGVILTFKKDSNNYLLVDGLQRISTLLKYRDNPFDFLNENDLFNNDLLLKEIVDMSKNEKARLEEDELSKTIKKVKKSILIYMKESEDYTKIKSNSLWNSVSKKLKIETNNVKDLKDILEKFQTYYDEIIKEITLPNIKIPAIVYRGEEENLADVFYNLNTNSVQLSKYEIHASTWGYEKTAKIKIPDEKNDLLTYVLNKYEKIKKDSDLDVDVKDNEIINEGITLFEYCYAIGEMLYDPKHNLQILFGEKTKSEKSAEPAGFDLLSLVSGLKVNQSGLLNRQEYLGKSSSDFLLNLKNIILEATTFVKDSLSFWLTEINKRELIAEKNYQIYHMVIAYIKNNYKLDFLNKKIEKVSKYDNSKFKKYLFKHFISDLFSEKWELNRQVSDLDRLLKNEKELSKYFFDIDSDIFSKDIDAWLVKVREKGDKKAANIDSKIFLNYLFKMKLSKDKNIAEYFNLNDENYEFDIEHIVPKKRIEDLEIAKDIPMSTLGNLCYLSIKDNRSKGSKTVYEYIKDKPVILPNKEFFEIINYPNESQLNFLNLSKEEFILKFDTFTKNRELALKEEFIKLLKTF